MKNTDVPHATPTRAATSVSFSAGLSGGYLHLCGLAADGRAFCWGYGGSGEIGSMPEFCRTPDGDVWCSSVPFPVGSPASTGSPPPPATDVVEVSLAEYRTSARR